ncbi:hypothetical protein QN360_04285 [Glaciimonas sp. CA11.2]|nr:hypothetical protein [Glaciimonas sp. CA11.2]
MQRTNYNAVLGTWYLALASASAPLPLPHFNHFGFSKRSRILLRWAQLGFGQAAPALDTSFWTMLIARQHLNFS